MIAPMRHLARRGWLALALSLGVHAALVGILTQLPSRARPAPNRASGPVVLHLLDVEPDDEGNTFLVPDPGRHAAPSTLAAHSAVSAAPAEIAIQQHPEGIIPVTHQTEASPAPSSVDPAVFSQTDGSDAGHAGNGGGLGGCFSAGTQVRSVVYVLDRSASMGPGGLLAAAVRELCASLERLPAATRFQVIVYHDQPEVLLAGRAELVAASAANVAHAAQLLNALRAEGSTSHLPALRLAISLAPEAIYLLTDADDLIDADRREVTHINRSRAIIHTIELNTANRARPDMPLLVLARENRGRYQAVDLGKKED